MSSLLALFATSPPVLFFFLGVVAVLLRSNLSIPPGAAKLLSLYLLWAIGFRGGVELAESGFSLEAMRALLAGALLALVVPLWAFAFLRGRVPPRDAAAIAACFGSVSVVTFLTACAVLDQRGVPYSGHMVAVMALMESPAIVVSLLLLQLVRSPAAGAAGAAGERGQVPGGLRIGAVLHEALLNGPVLLLLGSIAIGALTGQAGYATFKPLCTDAFPGVLAFFLLDLGGLAARRARESLQAPRLVFAFALLAPLINAGLAIALARALGMLPGDATLLAVLAASASYIAAPAALRLALPEANASLYVSLSLGVAFPFNVVVGIPLYASIVDRLW